MITSYTQVLCLLLFLSANLKTTSRAAKTNRILNNQPCDIAGEEFDSFKEKCNGTTGCNYLWHYCDNGTCKCAPIPLDGDLQCNDKSIISKGCITFDEENTTAFYGICMFTNGKSRDFPFIPEKVDEFLCGDYNRTGILCGECKENLYPLVHSFDMNCVECPHAKSNWWKFILATFLPLTIFYFIVMLFQINATSSHLLGLVVFSQGFVSPILLRNYIVASTDMQVFQIPLRYIGFMYTLWNLDILRLFKFQICLGTDTLRTLSLEYAVGVYPFLLMILSYLLVYLYDSNFKPLLIVWKPFKCIFNRFTSHWEVKTSLIDAYATFFLLSFIKILNVSLDLLVPVKVYQLNSTGHLTHSWRLYYNATVPYFGEKHLPFAILATIMFTVFVLLPTFLIILYPFRCFQKFLNFLPLRHHILHTFMDTILGCYKDGMEPGTSDCRWFFAVVLFLFVSARVIGAVTMTTMYFPLMTIGLVLLTVLYIIVQPYKLMVEHYQNVSMNFTLLLATIYVSFSTDLQSALITFNKVFIIAFTGVATVLYVSALIVKWLYNQRKFGVNLIRRVQARKQGYRTIR